MTYPIPNINWAIVCSDKHNTSVLSLFVHQLHFQLSVGSLRNEGGNSNENVI